MNVERTCSWRGQVAGEIASPAYGGIALAMLRIGRNKNMFPTTPESAIPTAASGKAACLQLTHNLLKSHVAEVYLAPGGQPVST